ncbi:MAG: hypothetical protein SOH99_02135 [Acidipropionibacterium acidipropionici]|jgi:hypothetical protein|nr:hypothetical protein [Acidipropionibacterium acidipropionici]MDN6803460.1 hypothetical protein [Bifidobacterium mongoliense]
MALAWIFLILSVLALGLAGAAFLTLARSHRRDAVTDYLHELLSPGIMSARNVVISAAQDGPVAERDASDSQKKVAEYRGAILQVMGIIQAAGPVVKRYVENRRSTMAEGILVYKQLNLILPSLREALRLWGPEVDLWESAKETNRTLNTLLSIRNVFEMPQMTIDDVRLPEESPVENAVA